MIQFLFQGGSGSHGPRAQALAAVTPGSKTADITAKPTQVRGLDTLAFWGHGDQFKLCGKSVNDLRSIISGWKGLNSGLKTIEIITCNSRHCTSGDPFARRLKSSFGIMSGTRGLKVKALPTTVTGKLNAWSILLAETNGKSWVYITAPGNDDSELMRATKLIQFFTNAAGKSVSFKGDIAQRADTMVREHRDRTWTMNYGYFKTLRATLGAV